MPQQRRRRSRAPQNMLAPKTLNDPYGLRSGTAKPRQRPWANASGRNGRDKKYQQENVSGHSQTKAGEMKQKWKAGGLHRSRNYLGRGVSQPKPYLSYNDQVKLKQYEQKYIDNERKKKRQAKDQKEPPPQYSVKYVGVTKGEMGVLSKRCLMPTTTNRLPKSHFEQREQKYRLDPTYVNRFSQRPKTASGIILQRDKIQSSQKRPGTSSGLRQSERVRAESFGDSTKKTVSNKISKSPGQVRPRTAPYRQSSQQWSGQAHVMAGNSSEESRDRPETAPSHDSHIVTDPNDEDQPDPDKYDRWIVRAIPPRPALSAGRSRTSNRAIGDPGSALSGGIGLGQKKRPGSAPPSSYIISSIQGQKQNSSQNNLRARHQQQPTPSEIPFQVHQRVRGWKLTSPHNTIFDPENSRTRKQMYSNMQNQVAGLEIGRSRSKFPNHTFSNVVKHERLTAEDIVAENLGRAAAARQHTQGPGYQYEQMIGDLNSPPSLIQPMMDPLNQAVLQEKRLRVKMRQTNAVVTTLDRWQRGRTAKPWRSGHHWDSPHPEVPLHIGKEFRWMSSTPSEYANMVRQNELEIQFQGESQFNEGIPTTHESGQMLMSQNDFSNAALHTEGKSHSVENELYLQHLKQKVAAAEDNALAQ